MPTLGSHRVQGRVAFGSVRVWRRGAGHCSAPGPSPAGFGASASPNGRDVTFVGGRPLGAFLQKQRPVWGKWQPPERPGNAMTIEQTVAARKNYEYLVREHGAEEVRRI